MLLLISRRGTLPPKPLFETPLTIHHLLFPMANVADRRSHALLKTLTQKGQNMAFDRITFTPTQLSAFPPPTVSKVNSLLKKQRFKI